MALEIPDRLGNPQATQYLGMFTWLTVQTNIICCARFAAVLAAYFLGSASLAALTVRLFPLSFGLGAMLTVMYYSLDYFQEENVRKRKQNAKFAPHCELAAHLGHGSGLPLAVLDAITLVGNDHPRPGVTGLVMSYIAFYMVLTLVNHAATKVWQYPIIAVVQRAAGWPAVLVFFAAMAGLMTVAAHIGVAIAGLA